METEFRNAIEQKQKLRITYFSKKDNQQVTRTCAPMDIAPHKSFPDKGDYFHVWDFEGSKGPHTSPLSSEQIISIEVLNDNFDPAEFVTWTPNWTIARNWGSLS